MREETHMVSVCRVTRLRMFIACALFFGAGVATAGNEVAAPASGQGHDSKAVTHWLDRAEQYAVSLPEAQRIEVLSTLCEPMAAANKEESLDRLLATIKDPQRRADQGLLVCAALGLAGKYDAAISRA